MWYQSPHLTQESEEAHVSQNVKLFQVGRRSPVMRPIRTHSRTRADTTLSVDTTQKLVMSGFQSLVYFCLQQLCAVIGHIAVWHPKSFVFTAHVATAASC